MPTRIQYLSCIYRVGQRVLIIAAQRTAQYNKSHNGPFTVEATNNNGAVRVNNATVTDTYNLRNVTPYTE
jgi:hypothetical protein